MRNGKLTALICAACVRTLSLIGGDAALDMLEDYANDGREKVIKELLKAWDSFDPVFYARRVVTKIMQMKTSIRINWGSPLKLKGMRYWTGSEHLNFLWTQDISDVRSLDLSGCEQLSELEPLVELSNLKWLSLSGCKQVSNLTALAGLSNLTILSLENCSQVSDLTPLVRLSKLEWLYLENCSQVSDLRPLAGLGNLRYLDLSGCKRVKDLTPLAGLTSLHIIGRPDVNTVE